MRSFTWQVGQLVSWHGVDYRIERLDEHDQVLLQRRDTLALAVHTRSELLAQYADGHLKFKTVDEVAKTCAPGWQRPLADLPMHVQQELARRKFYIDWLSRFDHTYVESALKPQLALAATELQDKKPPSVTTVYRWKRNLLLGGDDVRSLIPKYHRRGSSLIKTSATVTELFLAAIEEAAKRTPKASMKTIRTILFGKIEQENKFRLPHEQLKMPHRSTLYRLMERTEVYSLSVIKDGKAAADKRLRLHKAGIEVTDILERVEVDHTPLDCFLIDDKTWLPLGRPTLTVLVDCYSRMVIGYFLSFGGTSAAAVMGALRHAILPKKPATASMPGLSVVNVWSCYGLFQILVVDNGLEFHGQTLEAVAMDLGLTLQYCPKRQPWFKGRVERVLKTINYGFAHQLPGTSLARFIERGEYDPQKHAVMTLSEFQHAFEKWLLDDYAQTIHRGIKTTPAAKWQEGLSRITPRLPADVGALTRRIGLIAERSLRNDGFTLNCIRYSSSDLQAALHQFGPGIRCRLAYDPENLGSIEVWLPNNESPITVPAVNQNYAQGLTLYQHNLLQQELREMGRDAEDTAALEQARLALSQSVEALMNSRKQMQRRKAARLHGKTSAHPAREFTQLPAKPITSAVREERPSSPIPSFTSTTSAPTGLFPAQSLAAHRLQSGEQHE